MKQIELYANIEAYLDSFKRRDHYVPNVSQVGDVGEEVYLYDRVILTSESNPALFAIATGAGWNVSSESAVFRVSNIIG